LAALDKVIEIGKAHSIHRIRISPLFILQTG
jgi:hypothetical protein